MTPDILRRASRALLAAPLAAVLAACGGNLPAEVRSQAESFPVRANWSAAAAPVSPSTVSATLAVKEFLGSRLTTNMTLRGAPNTSYQWRIVRGDCAQATAAANVNAVTGLWTFATAESYPNVVTDAAGTARIDRTIAGSLDSLTAYSIRVRVTQGTATWHGTAPAACGNLQRSAGG